MAFAGAAIRFLEVISAVQGSEGERLGFSLLPAKFLTVRYIECGAEDWKRSEVRALFDFEENVPQRMRCSATLILYVRERSTKECERDVVVRVKPGERVRSSTFTFRPLISVRSGFLYMLCRLHFFALFKSFFVAAVLPAGAEIASDESVAIQQIHGKDIDVNAPGKHRGDAEQYDEQEPVAPDRERGNLLPKSRFDIGDLTAVECLWLGHKPSIKSQF